MEEIVPTITGKVIIFGLLVLSTYFLVSWIVQQKLKETIKSEKTRKGLVILVSIIMFCVLIYVVFKP